MKKITTFVMSALGLPLAFAGTLTVTASTPSTTLRSDGETVVTYYLDNGSSASINNISIDPAYYSQGAANGLSLMNDQCSGQNLAAGASCAFSVLINGQYQPFHFILNPLISEENNGIYSVMVAPAVSVSVLNITTDPMAYVDGLVDDSGANFQVLPVDTKTGNIGTAAVISTGFQNGANPSAALPQSNIFYTASNGAIDAIQFGQSSPQITSIPIGSGNNVMAMAASRDGSKVYVIIENGSNDTLDTIDTTSKTITATLPLGNTFNTPMDMVVSPDGNTLYIAGGYSFNVGIINLSNNSITTVPAKSTCEDTPNVNALALSPDGSTLYVSVQSFNGASSCADIATMDTLAVNKSITTFDIINNAIPTPPRILLSSDGNTLYLKAMATGNNIYTLPAHEYGHIPTLFASLPYGNQYMGFAITPDGSNLFITNTGVDDNVPTPLYEVNTQGNITVTPITTNTYMQFNQGAFVN